MSRLRVTAVCAFVMATVVPSVLTAQLNGNTTLPIFFPSPFMPGTVPVAVTPTVAAAIFREQKSVQAAATSGTLTSPITGVAIPAAIGQVVVLMMTQATEEVRKQIETALMQSGANPRVINQLMTNMPSLLSNPVPGQLQNCLSAFNGVINNANAAFLANPPAEFLGIHAVLLQISNAANAVPHP